MNETAPPVPARPTDPVPGPGPHHGESAHHARRWLVLGVLGLCQLMVVLDATIMNIALPSAQAELGFSDTDRQWVVTGYALAFGGLLLLGGRLADLFGRKRMLLVGLVGFAAASVLGGAATSIDALVLARVLQGVFGAVLAPAALSTLATTFTDSRERGRAFGVFGAIAGAGAAIGLLLGGALTEYADWSWCLYVNAPIAAVGVAGVLWLVRGGADAEGTKLDLPGTALAVSGLVAVVYGCARAESDGWGAPLTLVLLLGGVALLVAFVALERRVAHPLLPLRIVLDRRRGGAYLAMALTAVGMFAVFLFLTYYLQQTLGYAPLKAGVAYLPMVVGIVTGSTAVAARLLPRVGPRPLITTGQLLGAAGLLWLSQLEVGSAYATHVLPSLLVIGLGMGTIFGSSFNTATAGAARRDTGVASALVNTGQQVGGAIGTAALSTVFASQAQRYVEDGVAAAGGGAPSAQLLAEAAVSGETHAFFVAACVFAAAAVVSFFLLPKGPTPAGPVGAPPTVHA